MGSICILTNQLTPSANPCDTDKVAALGILISISSQNLTDCFMSCPSIKFFLEERLAVEIYVMF